MAEFTNHQEGSPLSSPESTPEMTDSPPPTYTQISNFFRPKIIVKTEKDAVPQCLCLLQEKPMIASPTSHSEEHGKACFRLKIKRFADQIIEFDPKVTIKQTVATAMAESSANCDVSRYNETANKHNVEGSVGILKKRKKLIITDNEDRGFWKAAEVVSCLIILAMIFLLWFNTIHTRCSTSSQAENVEYEMPEHVKRNFNLI